MLLILTGVLLYLSIGALFHFSAYDENPIKWPALALSALFWPALTVLTVAATVRNADNDD